MIVFAFRLVNKKSDCKGKFGAADQIVIYRLPRKNKHYIVFVKRNIKLLKLSAFVICSVLSSVSAILLASRIGSANHVAGDLFEFQVVAAVVLGGVSLAGGIGTLTGAALGVLILAVISNGLGMLNVESQWQMVVNGIIIIFAVGFDEIKRRKN